MFLNDLPLVAALIRNSRKTSINRLILGHSITRIIGPVTRQDILEYVDATLDNPSRYIRSGHAAPPFYLSRLLYPMFRYFMINKDLGLNLLRMVHGQQSVEWFGNISEGDMLNVKVEIHDICGSAAGDTLTLRTTISSKEKVLGTADTLFIIRAKKNGQEKAAPVKEEQGGRELFRRTIRTEEGQQLKYAKVSGDENFIHTSNFLARLAGLPRTIMHGVCIGAMATNSLLDEVLGGDMSKMKRISMRFANPVLPGEEITLVGYETAARNRILFAAYNSKGRAVLKNGEYMFSA